MLRPLTILLVAYMCRNCFRSPNLQKPLGGSAIHSRPLGLPSLVCPPLGLPSMIRCHEVLLCDLAKWVGPLCRNLLRRTNLGKLSLTPPPLT